MLQYGWFKRLVQKLKDEPKAMVYVPMTICNKHWCVGRLDVATKTWSFADSMPPAESAPFNKAYFDACIVLSRLLQQPSLQNSPPRPNTTFKSGTQVDGHSCGYFALNSIEADIFKTPLASPSTALYFRLRALLLICEEHTTDHGPLVRGPVLSRALLNGADSVAQAAELDQFPSHSRDLVDARLICLRDRLFPKMVQAPEMPHDRGSDVKGASVEIEPIRICKHNETPAIAPQPITICAQNEKPTTASEPITICKEDEKKTTAVPNFPNYRDVESSTDSSCSDTSLDSDGSECYFTDEAYLEFDYSDARMERRYQLNALKRTQAMNLSVSDVRNLHSRVNKGEGGMLESGGERRSQTTKDDDGPQLSDESDPDSVQEPEHLSVLPAKQRLHRSKLKKRTVNAHVILEKSHLWEKFRRKVLQLAPQAMLDPKLMPCAVWCPKCSKWVPLKAIRQYSCFEKHYKACTSSTSRVEKRLQPQAGSSRPKERAQTATAPTKINVKRIDSFFSVLPKSGDPAAKEASKQPCPGLTRKFDPRIETYLARTGAGGGGAPPLTKIRELALSQLARMNRKRSKLGKIIIQSSELRAKVNVLRESLYKWVNHKNLSLVRAAACDGSASSPGGPCHTCINLRHNKVFRNALYKPGASEDKVKYVPGYYASGFLNELSLQYHGLNKLFKDNGNRSIMLRFAQMLAQDEKTGNCYEIVRGMCEAIFKTHDRQRRGLGTYGLIRNQMFVNSMHSLQLMSPIAYKKLRKIFGAPTQRAFQ